MYYTEKTMCRSRNYNDETTTSYTLTDLYHTPTTPPFRSARTHFSVDLHNNWPALAPK